MIDKIFRPSRILIAIIGHLGGAPRPQKEAAALVRAGHQVIIRGAVVTRDVEPYSIVAGVPARMIKRRFKNENIDMLLRIKWWGKLSRDTVRNEIWSWPTRKITYPVPRRRGREGAGRPV